MEAKGGMVAGSHQRNEFVRIRNEGEAGAKPLKSLNGQVCQICGDTVGVTATGDIFVACNECAFPVCRACYEYERRDGIQSCPQCKTRYKRHKGSPRVDGDDDEDDVDDLENEFNYSNGKTMRPWQGEDVDLSSSSRHESQPIPLLTNGLSEAVKSSFRKFLKQIRASGYLILSGDSEGACSLLNHTKTTIMTDHAPSNSSWQLYNDGYRMTTYGISHSNEWHASCSTRNSHGGTDYLLVLSLTLGMVSATQSPSMKDMLFHMQSCVLIWQVVTLLMP